MLLVLCQRSLNADTVRTFWPEISRRQVTDCKVSFERLEDLLQIAETVQTMPLTGSCRVTVVQPKSSASVIQDKFHTALLVEGIDTHSKKDASSSSSSGNHRDWVISTLSWPHDVWSCLTWRTSPIQVPTSPKWFSSMQKYQVSAPYFLAWCAIAVQHWFMNHGHAAQMHVDLVWRPHLQDCRLISIPTHLDSLHKVVAHVTAEVDAAPTYSLPWLDHVAVTRAALQVEWHTVKLPEELEKRCHAVRWFTPVAQEEPALLSACSLQHDTTGVSLCCTNEAFLKTLEQLLESWQ